jgi:predicted nucleic acid-binding protein
VLNPAKLNSEATEALEGCVAAGEPIRFSAHSLIELLYAVERATNPFTKDDRQAVLEILDAEDSPFEVVPVTPEIANRVAAVPRTANAEPGDRTIVATAEVLGTIDCQRRLEVPVPDVAGCDHLRLATAEMGAERDARDSPSDRKFASDLRKRSAG